jgi:hypothetical protein
MVEYRTFVGREVQVFEVFHYICRAKPSDAPGHLGSFSDLEMICSHSGKFIPENRSTGSPGHMSEPERHGVSLLRIMNSRREHHETRFSVFQNRAISGTESRHSEKIWCPR